MSSVYFISSDLRSINSECMMMRSNIEVFSGFICFYPGREFWDFLVCLLQHCYQCQIVLASDCDIYVIKSISLPQRRIPRPNVKIIIENSFSAFLNRLSLSTAPCRLEKQACILNYTVLAAATSASSFYTAPLMC